MKFDCEKYKEIKEFFNNNFQHSSIKPSIIAISKNKPQSLIKEAIDCGIKRFGENRVQEAVSKFTNIKHDSDSDIELHLTGPLQRNKVKEALKIFDVFQINKDMALKNLLNLKEFSLLLLFRQKINF